VGQLAQPDLFEPERHSYHAVATNRQESATEIIWKHNARGNSENWHTELKIGTAMEQMPSGSWMPTRCTLPLVCWQITWHKCSNERYCRNPGARSRPLGCDGIYIVWPANWLGTRDAGCCRSKPTLRMGFCCKRLACAVLGCGREREDDVQKGSGVEDAAAVFRHGGKITPRRNYGSAYQKPYRVESKFPSLRPSFWQSRTATDPAIAILG